MIMDFFYLLMEMVGNVVGVVGVSSRTECNGEGFAIRNTQLPQIVPFGSAVAVEEWCRHPLDNPVPNSNQCIYHIQYSHVLLQVCISPLLVCDVEEVRENRSYSDCFPTNEARSRGMLNTPAAVPIPKLNLMRSLWLSPPCLFFLNAAVMWKTT